MSYFNVTDAVRYIGVDDHDIDLFENQYPVPNGMCYNSYVVLDDKVCVFDTTDNHDPFISEWLGNLEEALEGRIPDYLVIHHMESDHSSAIAAIVEKYPSITLIGNAKTFPMVDAFFPEGLVAERLTVADGDTLSLGSHELVFYMTPMVHWPEVMMTYEKSEKLLFSADGFGKFGTREADEEWDWEARRYYYNICGKFGKMVGNALTKVGGNEISAILPLHGPLLTSGLGHYIEKYQQWSSYTPDEEGVVILCASIHGNTFAACQEFEQMLASRGVKTRLVDLCRTSHSEALALAFSYERTVFAACSYDGGVFLPMADLLTHLAAKAYHGHKIALIENGSFAPCAVRTMKASFEGMKDIEIVGEPVTIRSALNDESRAALEELAGAIAEA